MFTGMLVLILLIAFFIYMANKWNDKMKVARVIDNELNNVDPAQLSKNTRNIINELKNPTEIKYDRFASTITLDDGQKLGLETSSMKMFQTISNLNYEPSRFEWAVLLEAVAKFRKTYL